MPIDVHCLGGEFENNVKYAIIPLSSVARDRRCGRRGLYEQLKKSSIITSQTCQNVILLMFMRERK